MDQQQALSIVVKAVDDASAVLKQVQNQMKQTGSAVDEASKGSTASLSGFQKVVSGFGSVFGGVMKGVQAATTVSAIAIGTVLTASLSGAISRVDTLNNASRTFANMGFAANDVTTATDALKKSILGLPTSLNGAITNVQLLASATGDIGKSQKIFSAMNDAILGFGGTADMVSNAVLQLGQALANGKIDAATWNSMLNSQMGPALVAIAKQMGITTGALKAGLSDGSISVQKFEDQLISLDQNGGGGLASLQQIAQQSTAGISTSMANLKTSMVRGMAEIIQAIGAPQIAGVITNIGSTIEGIEKSVAGLITSFKTAGGSMGQFGAVALPIIGVLAGSLGPLLTQIPVIGTLFSSLTGPVGLIVGLIAGMVAASPELQKALGGAVTILIGVFKQLQPTIKLVTGIFTNLLTTLGNALAPVITALAQAFGAIILAIAPLIPPLLQVAVAIIQQILLPLLPTIVTLITMLASVFTQVMTALMPLLPQLTGLAMLLINALAPILPQLANLFIQLITALMPLIPPLLQLVMLVLPPLISLFTVIANVLSAVLVAALTIVIGIISDFVTMWGHLINAGIMVFNWFMQFAPGVKAVFSNIKNAAGDMIGGIVDWFQKLPGKILGAIGGLGQTLYSAGSDLIHGLLSGAGSVLKDIGKFFLDKLPGWIQGPFKSAMGIHSPSKVFSGFGVNLIAGLTNGISGSVGMIKSAMGSVSSAVSTGLSVSASPTVTANINGQSGSVDVSASSAGASSPNVQSSADTSQAASSQPIVFQPTFNGPIIGNDSGLRDLSVIMANMLQDALKAQGVTDINMLRST